MPSIRIARLQELIKKRVAMVLSRDLNDPRLLLVTVTRTELANDLSHCKVYWSTLEEDGGRRAVERGLEDAQGYVRREVARIMKTKVTPEIHFIFDQSIEGAERISRLIREAREEDTRNIINRGEDPDAPPEDPDPS